MANIDYSSLAKSLGGAPLGSTGVNTAVQSGAPQNPVGQTDYSSMASQLGGAPLGSNGSNTSAAPEGAQLHDTGSFGGNLANSAGNFLGGIGHAIAHPIDTVSSLGKVALGGIEKLVPGQQGAEQDFNNVLGYYKQRYGSVENFLKTTYQDPVGTAADASLVFGGAAGIAKGVAGLAGAVDATDVASAASKVGDVANTAAKFTNPMSLVTAPLEYGTSKLGNTLKGLQDSLSENNLKVTPLQKTKLGAKLAPVIDLYKRLPTLQGTAGDEEMVNSLNNSMEDSISSTLQKYSTGQVANEIPKAEITTPLENLTRSPELFGQKGPIKSLIKDLADNSGDYLAPDILQSMKRNLGQLAYSGPFGETLSNEAVDAVRGIFQKGIEQALEKTGEEIPVPADVAKLYPGTPATLPIGDFNKLYGNVITLKKILGRAVNKPGIGFLNKLSAEIVGAGIGAAAGGPLSGAAGAFVAKTVAEHTPVDVINKVAGKAASAAGSAVLKGAKAIPKLRIATGVSRAGTVSKQNQTK